MAADRRCRTCRHLLRPASGRVLRDYAYDCLVPYETEPPPASIQMTLQRRKVTPEDGECCPGWTPRR